MTANLNPYLNFRGDARQAIDFYRGVFGGEASTTTFREGGMPVGPEDADKLMHAQLTTSSGWLLMAADVTGDMPYQPGTNAYSVSLSGDDETQLRGYWDGLADGATVSQPLEKAPWGDSFGMLTDRFGVSWLVNIAGAPAS